MDKIGYSMRFEGNCINTRLKNNIMKDYFEGIHFADAQFTAQGSGTNDAWDNEWERTDVNEYPNFQKVEGTFFPSGQIPWYYQGISANSNIHNPDPYNPALLIPANTGSGNHNCLTASVSDDELDRDLVYGPVVGDSAIYDTNPDEAVYLAKEALFKRLKANSDLLTIGSSADSSFNAFYQSMLSTNIGKFDSVRSSLSENDLEAADDINSVITEDNNIEENNKNIYDLIINTVSTGDTLSSSDTTSLESIFEQDWRTAGKGVYYAAGILGKEYYTSSSYSRFMEQLLPIKNDSVVKSAFEIKMHPNPSSNKLFFTPTPLKETIVNIFDSAGRTIISKPFSQEMDISFIEEGFYVVQIFSSSELLFNKTFIKIK
ncbi:MAG: T9SS type A sorting domain-containing protein [Bacteroidetes bacterium]|nr:T9SS type A sorting domain-containing protein [Bacteroidota bacterium]